MADVVRHFEPGDIVTVAGRGTITRSGYFRVEVGGDQGWVFGGMLEFLFDDAGAVDAGRSDAGEAVGVDAGTQRLADAGLALDAGLTMQRVRIVAANLTSGTAQRYEESGTRLLRALRPDVVAIQEFNVGDSSPDALRAWVTSTFGAEYSYVRGFRQTTGCAGCSATGIPNGVISRFPVVDWGDWDDVTTLDRDFTWARLDVPGPRDLVVVSVHLRTTNQTLRNAQATALMELLRAAFDVSVDVVIAGDFNTQRRDEPCFATLAPVVSVSGATGFPVDAMGNGNTNARRALPYDHVGLPPALVARELPVSVGRTTFPNGFVLDSRTVAPLSDLPPAQFGDSSTFGMQHMAVVRDVAY
ncbi:MAG: endonuclease/exonuclease/phosphatase family protein [Myxococcaceae bacterium]|nr:endonuclease/exonuclease/phosphatase family protein [Myxococcaceae bacterium]MCA3013931.1 endonuclease/exonuclease/phosphatase family protein [Myxococcaceae bacterium]